MVFLTAPEALATICCAGKRTRARLRAAPADLKSAARQFRLARGLTTQAALNAWLETKAGWMANG